MVVELDKTASRKADEKLTSELALLFFGAVTVVRKAQPLQLHDAE